jgi:hypothetical protein
MSLSYPMEAANIIQRELIDGEHVLWAGVPPRGLRLQRQDVLLIPFGLFLATFAFGWEYLVMSRGSPFFLPLFGLPFVAAALYLLVGRFIVAARHRARTTYGLTDQRVLIVSGGSARRVQSLPLRSLSDVSMLERSDGTGTILLGRLPDALGFAPGARFRDPRWMWPPYFERIPNARAVLQEIQASRQAAS